MATTEHAFLDPSALEAAWASAWTDFLSNRIAHAERRAAPFILALPSALTAADAAGAEHTEGSTPVGTALNLADYLVTLADLAHIAGAARGDINLLHQSIQAYDAHLSLNPGNKEAMRMRAETLLRSHQYPEAFAGFLTLYELSLGSAPNELAPFQLVHDAECIEDAVEQGADPATLAIAAAWRELKDRLVDGGDSASDEEANIGRHCRFHSVQALAPPQRALLGSFGAPLPLPPTASDGRRNGVTRALREGIDWAAAMADYEAKRAVVVDDLLSAGALAELQSYTRHGAHFRTLRRGYLGAFPSDGTCHPLILALAEELVAAAPKIFGSHALAMWWIFKYDETNPEGIGIHADPAAVNINLWLTDDAACLEGGGLAIYSHVPPLEQPMQAINREYKSTATEAALREELKAAGCVTTIPYKCNRAAIFISDQYHESLPFRFAPGYGNRRANLTLLFGDRWTPIGAAQKPAEQADDRRAEENSTGKAIVQSDGWDVFD